MRYKSHIMKSLLLLFSILFISTTNYAQNYADDVAQLIFENCASCHNPNGIAPFSLMNYQEVSNYAPQIYDAIAQDVMPPWPPNDNYKEFSHSRALNETDKSTILDWLVDGMPEGNPNNTPAPPVFSNDAILGEGDLEVQMPTYMSKATLTSDDYVCFSMPSDLLEDREIKAMEVVPGNPQIVHHCLVYIDETGTYETDSTTGTCSGPTDASLVGGFTPGATPLIFPNSSDLKLGMNLPEGSNIVFAMHYPHGSYGEFDSTKVIFHFYDEGETGVREVSADPVLQNWSFTLPEDEITTVTADFTNAVPVDVSILSVFPHMHLLGHSIRSYGLTPEEDTIRLIDIPRWDFHWQDFYIYKNLVKIPSNSSLHAEGDYDNTANNIHNPNSPPETIYPGFNTTDEMFIVYFHYLPYMQGDENHDLEAMTSLSLSEMLDAPVSNINTYPNPTSDGVTIEIEGAKGKNNAAVSVYDHTGKQVKVLTINQYFMNTLTLDWDGSNELGSNVPSGLYYVSIRLNGSVYSKKIVKL